MKTTIATRSTLITATHFRGYDACFNPYVGCQFGCTYCYVRFFVKDDVNEWGEFVRIRDHIHDKLPREINKGHIRVPNGKIKEASGKRKTLYRTINNEDIRLVIGTMTDPYQPIERKVRLTRAGLEHILKANYKKVGIFTRSPIVLDDLELIKQLPRARVHFSITPYERPTLKLIEPIPVMTERRFETIKSLKAAGIRVHVNVAPCIPIYSDRMVEEFAKELDNAGVDEFFVDPMQAYDEAFTKTKESLQHLPEWNQVEMIVRDKDLFQEWKNKFKQRWKEAWIATGNTSALAIWCDHVNHVWEKLKTGEAMNPRNYND